MSAETDKQRRVAEEKFIKALITDFVSSDPTRTSLSRSQFTGTHIVSTDGHRLSAVSRQCVANAGLYLGSDVQKGFVHTVGHEVFSLSLGDVTPPDIKHLVPAVAQKPLTWTVPGFVSKLGKYRAKSEADCVFFCGDSRETAFPIIGDARNTPFADRILACLDLGLLAPFAGQTVGLTLPKDKYSPVLITRICPGSTNAFDVDAVPWFALAMQYKYAKAGES